MDFEKHPLPRCASGGGDGNQWMRGVTTFNLVVSVSKTGQPIGKYINPQMRKSLRNESANRNFFADCGMRRKFFAFCGMTQHLIETSNLYDRATGLNVATRST